MTWGVFFVFGIVSDLFGWDASGVCLFSSVGCGALSGDVRELTSTSFYINVFWCCKFGFCFVFRGMRGVFVGSG